MMRALYLLIALAVTSLAAYAAWGWQGRPQPMRDVAEGKLRCVSYAPYREGQSPFVPNMVIPPSQIEEDLQLLAKRFDCIRTYSVQQGLAEVPRIAAKHGLKVLLGVWIGRDRENKGKNEGEIAIAARLANDPANKDTIMAIVVGNEVLLRREFTAPQMIDWITSMKKQVSVPVTYADVWEFWLKYPAVAEAVDYITVHILPYWEDHPVSLGKSMDHLRDILAKMHSAFPGKTLFIGETGWPSAGRSREGAVPSRANQARFIRDFVHVVQQEKVDYNVIESFDQPWKRIQEGTVGGHWGIIDVARQQKFPFTGPVSDNVHWRQHAAIGIAIGTALLLTLAVGGYGFGLVGWLFAAAGAQAAGAILVRQWQFVIDTSLNLGTWLVNLAGLALSAIAALMLLRALADQFSGRETVRNRPASLATVVSWLRLPNPSRFDRAMALGLLRGLTVFGATCIALQLLFDPRYRDFHTNAYLIPAVGFALLWWLQERMATGPQSNALEERWLACLLGAATLVSLGRETLYNFEMIGWAATALIVALPWLYLAWVKARAARRARAASPGRA